MRPGPSRGYGGQRRGDHRPHRDEREPGQLPARRGRQGGPEEERAETGRGARHPAPDHRPGQHRQADAREHEADRVGASDPRRGNPVRQRSSETPGERSGRGGRDRQRHDAQHRSEEPAAFPAADRHQRDHDQDHRQGGDRPGPGFGIYHQPDPGEVEEDRVAGGGPRELAPPGGANHAERRPAFLLDRPRIEMGDVVLGGVVPLDPVGEGEVEGRGIEPEELGEIGVVGEELVDGHRHGAGRGVPLAPEDPELVEIVGAGLEHRGGAAGAPGLEVEGQRDVLGPGMLGHEGGGAEQARFLAVGEEEDHVVVERRAGPEGAEALQQHRRSGAVVARGGSGAHAVVVGHQHDGAPARGPARQPGDHVLDPARLREPGAHRRGPLDLGLEPGLAETAHDVVADPLVVGGSGRMGTLGHRPDVDHGPLGGEDRVGGGGRDGVGRPLGRVGEESGEEHQGDEGVADRRAVGHGANLNPKSEVSQFSPGPRARGGPCRSAQRPGQADPSTRSKRAARSMTSSGPAGSGRHSSSRSAMVGLTAAGVHASTIRASRSTIQ